MNYIFDTLLDGVGVTGALYQEPMDLNAAVPSGTLVGTFLYKLETNSSSLTFLSGTLQNSAK